MVYLNGHHRHVGKALRAMMKGLQTNGDVDEEDVDDMVCFILDLKEFHSKVPTAHESKGTARQAIR